MTEQRSGPRPVVWLSVGVLIVLVGAALNAVVGAWGGIVVREQTAETPSKRGFRSIALTK